MSAALVYVYGIARGGQADLSSIHGLADARVERIAVGGLEAIVSRHTDPRSLDAREETLVRHDAVCSALMAQTPVAPARFGSIFEDEADLRRALESRESDLAAVLDRLGSRVELGVRAFRARTPTTDAGTASSGAAYLNARLAERREATAAGKDIDARLAPLAAARTMRIGESTGVLMSGSYLVDRDGVDRFRGAVAELDRARADFTLVCTGPWPPYSFVEDGE